MEAEKLYSRINRLRKLDYRRLNRLTTKERSIFISRNDLHDNLKYFALRYKSITKCSLKDAFRWAEKHWGSYNNYTSRHLSEYRKEKNGPYLEKEFISRGYVPIDTFKKKPGFNYIESNQPINGKKYIYPRKCTRGLYVKDWNKYPYIYTMQEWVGIPNYTKVDVNYSL